MSHPVTARGAAVAVLADRWRRAAPWKREAALVTIALGLTYGLVLRHWRLWEDQSIYHYMAWGVRHGRVLYRDTINMNWPGTVLVHLLAQSLFGMAPAGVRAVEVALLGVLGLATTSLLRAYGVGPGVRAASLTLFMIAYLGAGHEQTAQRESFMTPCLAVAVLPFLVDHVEGLDNPRRRWLLGGLAAAAAVSIKPTAALPLAGALVYCLVLTPDRRAAMRRLLAYLAAAVAGLSALALFLARYGDLRGFSFWAVEYTFGAYASQRFPPLQRLAHFQQMSAAPPLHPLVLALEIGAAAVALAIVEAALLAHDPAPLWSAPLGEVSARLRRLAAASLARPREVAAGWRVEIRDAARRVTGALVLLSTVALSIYLQGKTSCPYHYIPLWWAASVAAAVSVGALLRDRLPPRVELAAVLLACAAFAWSLPGWRQLRSDSWDPRLARSLDGALRPGETVVMFGHTVPGTLCALERPTPLPFVDSWIMYAFGAHSPRFRDAYAARFRQALADPHVRFFLVQRGVVRDTDGGGLSEALVESQFPPAELRALGYARSRAVDAPWFWDVYERTAAGQDPPRP